MFIDDVDQQARKFEGVVPWFYLDSAVPTANVTVGIGFLVAGLAQAIQMFDGIHPTEYVIADYQRVRAMTGGKLAKAYHSITSVDMPPDTMDLILRKKLNESVGELRSLFLGFDDYPDAAKAALLDMDYNLGRQRFTRFQQMIDAVRRGDWTSAANQCHRRGIQEERNQWTVHRFLSCVGL